MAARSTAAVTAGMIMALLWTAAAAGDSELSWDGPIAVDEVLEGNLLRLADQRVVRLAGIRVPAGDDGGGLLAERARRALGALLEGQQISLAVAEAPYDRYGRLVAQIERADGLWLQGALLEQGLAQVQTRPGETARAKRMLALEQTARAARRGLWAAAAFMAREANAVDREAGRFRIVQGRVVRVAPTEHFVYLNFGDDWRTDFTVRMAGDLARSLASAGLDVRSLAGRRIEIRGLVLDAGGPLIELSHPEQMQVLP
jgi:micrococcal nuclease